MHQLMHVITLHMYTLLADAALQKCLMVLNTDSQAVMSLDLKYKWHCFWNAR